MNLKLNLKVKMLIAFGSITLFAVLGLGFFNYFLASQSLKTQALEGINLSINSTVNSIEASIDNSIMAYLMAIAENNKKIVEEYYQQVKKGAIKEDAAKDKSSGILTSQIIGKTGYLYCLNSSGTVVVHPKESMINRNLYDNDFIRRIISNKDGYSEYKWKNPDEKVEREKSVYSIYFKPWDWYICASSYREEFLVQFNMDSIQEHILSQFIGKKGHLFIIDTNGSIVLDSGNNVKYSRESEYISEILMKKNGIIHYIGPSGIDNKNENRYVSFKLISSLGWIVISTAGESELFNKIHKLTVINITFLILSLIVTIITGFIFSRSLMKNLAAINTKMRNITSNTEKADLSSRIEITTHDEISEIAQGVNKLMSMLNRDMLNVEKVSRQVLEISNDANSILENSIKVNMGEIDRSIKKVDAQIENTTAGVEELTATLEEIVRNIDSILQNMERQAAAVEESASSIEEMVRNIENTTKISIKTKDISTSLNGVATDGGIAVKASITSIKEIAEYSQQIIKILQLISNIAKQTNLLAMNASIEAAHAGDAGKGFAIVADEIRRMSEDTNKNAREIGDVVNSIVTRIEDSVKLAEKAGIGLDMINAYSKQSVQIVSELTVSMEEQNNGAKEILGSTQDLVQITEEVKISMQEQKNATDEFSSALMEIRDLSLENKSIIKQHIGNMGQLVQSIESIKSLLLKNKHVTSDLGGLVDKFVLEDSKDEKTGLKLIE